MSGPPAPTPSKIEERHDSLGARRTWGEWGGHVGAPRTDAEQNRGASRFTRGATNVGGWGGPCRGPRPHVNEDERTGRATRSARNEGEVGGGGGPRRHSETTAQAEVGAQEAR